MIMSKLLKVLNISYIVNIRRLIIIALSHNVIVTIILFLRDNYHVTGSYAILFLYFFTELKITK